MLAWVCGEILLLALMLFIVKFLYGQNIKIIQIAAVCAVSSAVYFLAKPLGVGALFLLLTSGIAALLTVKAIGGERTKLLQMFWLMLGGEFLLLPVIRFEGEFSLYCLIGPAALLIAAIAAVQECGFALAAEAKLDLLFLAAPVPVAAVAVTLLFSVMSLTEVGVTVCFFVLALVYFISLASIQLLDGYLRERAQHLEADKWQMESRDYINVIRSQRHDLNIHLHAISGLIKSGRYEECDAYVKKLVSDASAINDIMPVSDAVIGSMLYNMREEARKKGSEIYYNIKYDLADVLCSGFECNKIIGNLLQNAVDAIDSEEAGRFGIKLGIFKRRGNTVIVCENFFKGCPDVIRAAFEAGYSTKQGHDGIGLTTVLRTVQRYGGQIYPEFGGDTIKFIVTIPNRFKGVSEDENDKNADS